MTGRSPGKICGPALVTGAASGIGRAIATMLADAGARTIFTDRDEEMGREAASRADSALASFVPLDVTSRESVEAARSRVETEVGALGVLVNCAGAGVVRPFLETDEDFWRSMIDLNLMGVLRCTKAFLPAMVEQGSGRIVNISSDAGRVGSLGQGPYSAAKGGVIAFTKTVAREVAHRSVTVNVVCPGPTLTPATIEFRDNGGAEWIADLERSIPMGRLAEPTDVAAATVFLATCEAGYITGQALSINGGRSMA